MTFNHRRVFQLSAMPDTIFETAEFSFLKNSDEPSVEQAMVEFGRKWAVGIYHADRHAGGDLVRFYGTYDKLASMIITEYGSNETARSMPYFVAMMLGDKDAEVAWNNGGDKVGTVVIDSEREDGNCESVVIIQHMPENVVEIVQRVTTGEDAVGQMFARVFEYELEDSTSGTLSDVLEGSLRWVDRIPVVTVGNGEYHKNYTVVYPDADSMITIEHCIGEA